MNNDRIETEIVKISKCNKTFIIDTCYRPRNYNCDIFETFSDNKLSSVNSSFVDVTLCGDVNLDLLKLADDRAPTSFCHAMN